MSSEKNNVFAVIVTYNGMSWIEKCLQSLRNSVVPVQPIVVDNLSNDGTVSFIKENFPEVELIENDKNSGFGQANNVGIIKAMNQGANYILLLNQDAWIEENMIGKLLVFSDNNTLLSPVHLNGSGEMLDHNFKHNTIMNPKVNNSQMLDNLLLTQNEKCFEVSYVNAACWFLPSTLIREIGGFNPLFFHYGEDNNYLNRVHYHNKRICVVLESYVYHDREIFGNKKVFAKQMTYRNMLAVSCDINKNSKQRRRAYFKIFIESIYFGFKQKKIMSFFSFFTNKAKLVAIRKQIKQSRELEKQTGNTWLDL